jgi:hypothetical protein
MSRISFIWEYTAFPLEISNCELGLCLLDPEVQLRLAGTSLEGEAASSRDILVFRRRGTETDQKSLLFTDCSMGTVQFKETEEKVTFVMTGLCRRKM